MKKSTTILFLFITTISIGQEYFQFKGTEKIVSSKEGVQLFLEETKENYNKTSAEKYGYIAKNVSYELLETIKRNDSTITFVKLNVELKKMIYNKETIFELQDIALPKLELTTVLGKKMNNKALLGKVTFINLWFINCPPCLKEIPSLNELKKEYETSVNFVGITFDTQSNVINFLKKTPFDFEIVAEQKELLETKFRPESYPKILIVDKEGIIKFISNGIQEKETSKQNIKHTIRELKETIDELISK